MNIKTKTTTKKLFGNSAKYENLTDKKQALERLTINKIQVLKDLLLKIRKIIRHRQRNLEQNLPHHCMVKLKR